MPRQYHGWTGTKANANLDALPQHIPGNGRTPTTLAAYLANNAIWNVLDGVNGISGAKGDDAADDLAVIQAVGDACSAAGGGRVWLPPGRTYKTTGQLNLKDNVELYGPGATIHCTMAAGTAIYANGALSGTYFPSLTANATVRGYQVQVASSTGFTAGAVVEIQEVTTGEIEVNVVDSVPDGTHLNLVYPLSRGFTTANAGRVILVAPVVKPSVRGIRLLTTGTTVGVAFQAVDRGLVRECEFTTAGTAVNVMTSLHVDILDNKALDCGYTPGGPVIGYRASTGGRCADNVITRYAGDEAIVLFKNNQFIDIIDNRIFRARLSGGCGIQLDTDNKHILIKGNKVVKAGNAGIYLTGNNEHIEVLGNHCIDCAADGIGIDNGFHIAVSDNHLVTNSAWGLRIAATCSNVIHGDNYYRSNASGSVTDLNSTGAVNPRGGFLDLTSGELRVSGTKVLGARDTGWSAGTGTPNKGAFAADTATAVQAAQRVLALEAMLRTQGVIN